MADFKIGNEGVLAMLDALAAVIDEGTQAQINIYTAGGGIPAGVDVAISDQTLLAELPMSATAFGAAADQNPGGRITADTITADSSANATGTAAFFRILKQAGGTAVVQGTVGTSGEDINFNTVSFVSGANISISSYVINQGEG